MTSGCTGLYRKSKNSRRLTGSCKRRSSKQHNALIIVIYRWNVNRLMELEDQMGKFKSSIGDSIRKGPGVRSRINSAYDDRSPSKVFTFDNM